MRGEEKKREERGGWSGREGNPHTVTLRYRSLSLPWTHYTHTHTYVHVVKEGYLRTESFEEQNSGETHFLFGCTESRLIVFMESIIISYGVCVCQCVCIIVLVCVYQCVYVFSPLLTFKM